MTSLLLLLLGGFHFNDVTTREDGGPTGLTTTCNRMRANTWTYSHYVDKRYSTSGGTFKGVHPLPWQRVSLCVWTAFWRRARFFHREDVELEQASRRPLTRSQRLCFNVTVETELGIKPKERRGVGGGAFRWTRGR